MSVRRPHAAFWIALAVAVSYCLLGCLVYYPYWPLDGKHMIDCVCGDPIQEVWFLDWTRFAVFHGHNPFITHYLNAPVGANLAVNTSFPLLGLLAAPVTATLGPLAAYNFLLRLALASSAFTAYLVLRRYTTWRPAAYFGGLLFGFSAYMIGHAHRHLFLTFVPLVPLFIPVVDEWLVRARANPWRAGALLGALCGLQFLISPEICLATVIFVVVALIPFAIRYRHQVLGRWNRLWRGVITATGGFLVLAGYPAYLLLAGPDRPVGPIHSVAGLDRFRGDLLSPVIGTRGELLTPSRLYRVGDRFTNRSITENGFYLGVLLGALLIYLIVRTRRSSLVVGATLSGVVAFLLGLGSKLTIKGHDFLSTMPFTVFRKLPLLQNLEAARFSLFVQFGAAIVLAVGLDTVRSYGWWSRRRASPHEQPQPHAARRAAVGTLVAAIALAPLIPRVPLMTRRTHTPPFFTTAAVRRIPQGALALTYPFNRAPGTNDPMLWQAMSQMRFRIFGGEVFVPAADRSSTYTPGLPDPSINNIILAGTKYWPHAPKHSTAAITALRTFLQRYRVAVVLVDPGKTYSPQVTAVIAEALAENPRHVGGMDVWLHVQQALTG